MDISFFTLTKNKWVIFFALLNIALLVVVLTLFVSSRKHPALPHAIMGNQALNLTQNQILTLEAEARSGSEIAALRLSHFYSGVYLSPPKAIYWAQIAAARGGPEAEYEYGLLLSYEKSSSTEKHLSDEQYKNGQESYNWICRAARQNLDSARSQITLTYGKEQLAVCLQGHDASSLNAPLP